MKNTKDRNDRWLGMGAAKLVMECQDLCKQRDELLTALEYAIKQVPELATVPGIAAAIASVKENSDGH